jgi:hypothetical protein
MKVNKVLPRVKALTVCTLMFTLLLLVQYHAFAASQLLSSSVLSLNLGFNTVTPNKLFVVNYNSSRVAVYGDMFPYALGKVDASIWDVKYGVWGDRTFSTVAPNYTFVLMNNGVTYTQATVKFKAYENQAIVVSDGVNSYSATYQYDKHFVLYKTNVLVPANAVVTDNFVVPFTAGNEYTLSVILDKSGNLTATVSDTTGHTSTLSYKTSMSKFTVGLMGTNNTKAISLTSNGELIY